MAKGILWTLETHADTRAISRNSALRLHKALDRESALVYPTVFEFQCGSGLAYGLVVRCVSRDERQVQADSHRGDQAVRKLDNETRPPRGGLYPRRPPEIVSDWHQLLIAVQPWDHPLQLAVGIFQPKSVRNFVCRNGCEREYSMNAQVGFALPGDGFVVAFQVLGEDVRIQQDLPPRSD